MRARARDPEGTPFARPESLRFHASHRALEQRKPPEKRCTDNGIRGAAVCTV